MLTKQETKHQEVIDLRLEKLTRLQAKRDNLVDRLDEGTARIEERRATGSDVTFWEDHWIELHHQYEQVCQELRDAHASRW